MRGKRRQPRIRGPHPLPDLEHPEFQALYLDEPRLVVGGGVLHVDPKAGLALYGPVDVGTPGRRSSVRLGVIGTGPMIDATLAWIERCASPVPAVRMARAENRVVLRPMDPVAYPFFPGLRAAFSTEFVADRQLVQTLGSGLESELRRIPIFEPRVTRLIDVIVSRLTVLAEQPSPPDVVICALSTEVRKLCTTPSRHRTRSKGHLTVAMALKRRLEADRARGQASLLDPLLFPEFNASKVPAENDLEEQSVFHHGLKARAMPIGLPTQLAWQTTFEGATTVEDQATRAWNFWTAIYYKAGGVPWRVQGLDRSTCYVGVSFYQDKRDNALHCCMAQAFSASGEGIVMRGQAFQRNPKEKSRTPHLPKQLAADLIRQVLSSYAAHTSQTPGRVVVHKWQRFTPDERSGFEEGIAAVCRAHDLVAFGDRGIRFFRKGTEPVLRGTMVPLSNANTLLFTRGFVPYLEQYPGMRVPRPIEIVEHYGDSSMSLVCGEILALSKLDWNTAAFASKDPITTAFASDVGHILSELPSGVEPRTQYRFYM